MRSLFVVVLATLFSSNIAFGEDYLFRVAGSNTVGAHLAPSCAADFLKSRGLGQVSIEPTTVANEQVVQGYDERTQSWQRIFIAAHGSSTGFKALASSSADLAISSRPIKEKEVIKLGHLGNLRGPDSEHTVAIDGLAILVHPENPLSTLTVQQLGRVFSGEIDNWEQLGGRNLPISLYARDDRSGTWDTFKNLVLAKRYKLASSAQRFESNDELSDRVSADIGGIGFAGLASVRDAKLLAVADDTTQALIPERITVATEDYPLSRRLYFYQPSEGVAQNPALSDYVQHCLSEQGQELVTEVGFVTQNIIAVDQPVFDNAPDAYRELSRRALRLSVNFRFDRGRSLLDSKALKDIDRVADFLNRPENEGRRVYLVGFTDANSRAVHDQLIARFRALSVQARLIDKRIPIAASYGLGAFMPVASGEGQSARLKNARVEIWIDAEARPQVELSMR